MQFNEVYLKLHEKYKALYPDNPDGVLLFHLSKTGLSPEAGIIYLAVKNTVEIPEVEQLISEGKSLEEASKLLSKDIKADLPLLRKAKAFSQQPTSPPSLPSPDFGRVQIVACGELGEDRNVSLYGRVVAVYVGESVSKDFWSDLGIGERLLFTLKDHSGMILAEIDEPLEITLMRGSVIKVNGSVKIYNGKRYISASTVVRLQSVEDGFQDLSLIEVEGVGQMPESEGNRLIKPSKARLAETVTVGKGRRSDYFLFGCFLCAFAILPIPVISLLACLGGCALMALAFFTEKPTVKEFETIDSVIRLLVEHHPPWLRDRCLSLKLFNKRLYLCARCTGTVLGFATASIISYMLSPYLVVFLALPAMIDWGTQKLCLRESSNRLRVLTGFSLGIALNYSQSLSLNIRLGITLTFLATMSLITFRSIKTVPSYPQTGLINRYFSKEYLTYT